MNRILMQSLIKLNRNIFTTNLNPIALNSTCFVLIETKIHKTDSIQCRFAGHSKWANIKHTKLSNDAKKSKIFNKLILKIKASVQKTGGTDMNVNREFADVIGLCRKANMPNTTIDKAVKRGLEKRLIPMQMEVIGPNGCLLILDAQAESKSNLTYQVRTVLKKYIGFGFANDGRAAHAFEEKGIIRIKNLDKDNQKIDMSKAEEIAIEADAEEVKVSDEDDSVITFITEPNNCVKCRKYIEDNTNYELMDFGIELIPFVRVDLPEDTLIQVCNAIEELEDLEEIKKVYDNVN